MRVLLNGCFDCLHAGHKHLIDYAIKIANKDGKMIFLLNTDESIKKLKGETRPIQGITDRKEAIKGYWSLRTMRYAREDTRSLTLVSFNTEQELAKKINYYCPDILIKGDDRPDVREIVGYTRFPICIVPRLRETASGAPYSTTRQIEKATGKPCPKH